MSYSYELSKTYARLWNTTGTQMTPTQCTASAALTLTVLAWVGRDLEEINKPPLDKTELAT